MKKKSVPECQLVEIESGEVGDDVHITTPHGCFTATWLGTVSNGRELAEAMRLMHDIAEEHDLGKFGKIVAFSEA